ncbi:hypothetical protein [Gilvimarinus sp. DA14]|uniref:hypothetical protein n=1 Tax=Gilvimarinus sp. DA14 TaxID=2956798 RepID=UPI0020B76455|nr:hypothetical protein [Gilvimarinus sp. DA14]UTF61672.1 hypothetical protein NHM04_07740 [Gilvimarinus sp. DA14]
MSDLPAQPLRYLLRLALLLAGLLAIITYYFLAGDEAAQRAAQEGGLIDLSSALGYFICAGLMAIVGGRHVIKHHYPLILSLLLLGMRELDFDKRFSTYGVFKSQTLRSADVSWLEKGLSLAIILAVLWLLVVLIKRYTRPLWSSVWRFEAVSLITGFGCGMLVLARLLDGIARKLSRLNIAFSEHQEILTTITEEVLELGVPLCFILAFFAYYRVYHPGAQQKQMQ